MVDLVDLVDLVEGKIYRKNPYFMGKFLVSCKNGPFQQSIEYGYNMCIYIYVYIYIHMVDLVEYMVLYLI